MSKRNAFSTAFPALFLSAALATLAGCTSDASRKSPSASVPAQATCGLLGATKWGTPLKTRVITAASVVVVANSAVRSTPVSGIGAIAPQVAVAGGLVPDTSQLLSALAGQYPVEHEAGPDAEDTKTFDLASLKPGTYVAFTGADLLQIHFATSCIAGGSGTPMTGTASTWLNRAIGVLDCATNPPTGSTAVVAKKFCII